MYTFFKGKSARFRLYIWGFPFVCMYALVCYNRSYGSYLSENRKYKMTFIDFDICHRMASLRKWYSVTLTYFSKVKTWNRDLPTVANAHTSVTSASNAVLPTVANVNTSVTSASTAVLSSSLARHELTYSSNRPFKCVECEFKCVEGDVCSTTNCQPTRRKRARHLKVVLPDSVTFV